VADDIEPPLRSQRLAYVDVGYDDPFFVVQRPCDRLAVEWLEYGRAAAPEDLVIG
jgi:hypothetical protein